MTDSNNRKSLNFFLFKIDFPILLRADNILKLKLDIQPMGEGRGRGVCPL